MTSTVFKALIFSLTLCAAAISHAAEPNYDDLIQESLLLRNNGDFPQSEARLRQALPLANETNELAYLLAMVVAFQDRFDESISILDSALRIYPDDIQLLIGKARVLSFQGLYPESIDFVGQALALDANNIEALNLKARVYYYQQRHDDARTQYNAVLALAPSNSEAIAGLNDVELAAQASASLDRSSSGTPAYNTTNMAQLNYDQLIQESLRLRNNGEFLQSEEALKIALPLANETNEVSFLLAMVIAFQERFIEAINILDAALETYPNDMQLILGKARVLSFQGFYRESIDIADQALAMNANNIEAMTLKARVYYYQRRYADARTAFNSVIAREPSNLEALVGLYDVELAAGEDDAALVALNLAERVAPEHIDVTTRRERRTMPLGTSAHIVTASIGRSNLDLPGFVDWQTRTLEYRYRTASRHQFYLRREYADRFGLDDTLYEVGGLLSGTTSTVELALAHTSESEILPQRRIRLAGNMLLMQAGENIGSTMLGISLTQSKYTSGDVNWMQLDFTHYLLNVNAWISPGVGIVKDETGEKTVGWNIGAHWQTNSRLLIGYNYTDAPETELNVTTQTNVHHVYFRVDINDDSNVRVDLSRNTRQNSYTQEAISLSIQHKF